MIDNIFERERERESEMAIARNLLQLVPYGWNPYWLVMQACRKRWAKKSFIRPARLPLIQGARQILSCLQSSLCTLIFWWPFTSHNISCGEFSFYRANATTRFQKWPLVKQSDRGATRLRHNKIINESIVRIAQLWGSTRPTYIQYLSAEANRHTRVWIVRNRVGGNVRLYITWRHHSARHSVRLAHLKRISVKKIVKGNWASTIERRGWSHRRGEICM